MKGRDILIYLSLLFKGDWDKIYQCIKNKTSINDKISSLENEFNSLKENIVTIIDDNYPSIFKNCGVPTMPFVLYYKGDLSLLNEGLKRLTIVGSRNSSKYGENSVKKIVHGLDNEVIIVSGLAKGIDSVALSSALSSNKKVIAIIGNGINFCYPEENLSLYNEIIAKGGLIISEYPPNTPPESSNFRWRNRLLAMVSSGILIGEGKLNSGTKITASFGIQFNRNVGCIPYEINKESLCNQLIKDGASLIETSEDAYDLIS